MKRILGYPIYDLLNIKNGVKQYSKATNFYFLFLIHFLIFIPILKLWIPTFIELKSSLYFFSVIIIAIIIIRLIISYGEKYFLRIKHSMEDISTVDETTIRLFKFIIGANKFYCSFYNFFEKYILSVLKKSISNDSHFDISLIVKFKEKIKKEFNLDSNKIGTDNYWLSTIQIVTHSEILMKNLMNWLNLYSFLKNLSMVGFLLCFEYGAFITLQEFNLFSNISQNPLWESIIFSGIYFGSLLLMLRYWIIYRNYYTKYIIRAYIAIK